MEPEYSAPLTEFPSLLSAVSMVSDDRAEIVKGLVRAERRSPPRYGPARDLFLRVLQGDFSYAAALAQAKKLTDDVERDCALDILRSSKAFLDNKPPARVDRLAPMSYTLPNGMALSVSPVWLRQFEDPRLMVLHFWRTPFADRQLSAIGRILRDTVMDQQPRLSECEIDFVTVSIPLNKPQRQFKNYSWKRLRLMEQDELSRFLAQLCEGWTAYRRRGPRVVKRRRPPDLFGR